MRVLLLFLLAGLCSGIQYPLQYVYHYRAKVGSGFEDINKGYIATSELKANLNVYISSPTSVVFKLDDVAFGDYNGERDCQTTQGHPSPWVTPQQASQLGRYPFGIESGLLIFNTEEEQGIINFYKSIISLFSIAPLKEAFFGSSSNYTHSSAYTNTEDTVMGMCTTTYTQHQLTGIAAAQRQQFMGHHVINDVQASSLGEYTAVGGSKTTKTTGGRKTSAGPRRKRRSTKRPASQTSKTSKMNVQRAPAISNTLWEVMRSVNLEDCSDRVEHQHALRGVYCPLSSDQCENLFSRNSHGVYYLRGDANGMRLESAVIKGAIVISPYGFEAGHIETITKQKLALVSVEHLDIDAPNLADDSTVTTDDMVFQLTLPYADVTQNNYRWAKMGTMKETIAALTGVYITEELQEENEARVVAMLNGAAAAVASGNLEAVQKAPVLLNYAAILMYDFTREEITRVSSSCQPAARELFYGVLAEVGTQPAVEVMLDLIRKGEVSALRQVIFFGSLNVNVKSASTLRPILNFLKSQNLDASPFKTSQSLINFAAVVKRLCLSRRNTANSFDEFAYQRCVQDGIAGDLLDYLTSELQEATLFWKQMVLVKALVTLSTVEATNALLPFVLGARECDNTVRAVAMDSLASWNAAGFVYRSQIVQILLDIFENPAESRVLRARALGYLTSWELTSTEWTRLAFTTKRRGLQDLSALTYSIIRATSEFETPEMIKQRQYARHALQLAKPSSAADRYSSYENWLSYNFQSQIMQINHINIVKDPMSPLPAELSIFMQRSFGGARFYRKGDFMISNDNGNLVDIFAELFRGTPVQYDEIPRNRFTNFINMLKADLNIEEKVRSAIRGLDSVVGTGGIQLFVPFENIMLLDALKSISQSARDFNLVGPASLYINPVDNTFTTVNDIGLPVITNVARPSIVTYKGSVQFNAASPDYALSFNSFGVTASSFLRVNIETLIPWSRTKVAAGVSNTNTLNLPFSPKIQFTWLPGKAPSSIVLEVAPTTYTQTTLLAKVNMPYTIIRDTAPANIEGLTQALKVVYINGEKGPQYQHSDPFINYATDFGGSTLQFDEKTGLPGSVSWDDITPEMVALFPNLMFFSGSLSFDFGRMLGADSKLRLNYTTASLDRLPNSGKFVSKYGQDSFQEYELCGKEDSPDTLTQQTGQQFTDDDYIDEQFSQSAQSPDQEFESFGSFGQQQSQVPAQLYDPTEAETVRPSQGIGDVAQAQLGSFLNYLRRQTGWKSEIYGGSLRLEALVKGKVEVAYEAVLAQTKCYALTNQVLTKTVLVFVHKSDDRDTLCFEIETTRPKINDLDTLAILLDKNLDLTGKIEMYTGKKCSIGPITTITGKQSLSEAGRELIVKKLEDLQTCASWQRTLDPLDEFVRTAHYDQAEYSANVTLVDSSIYSQSRLADKFQKQGWSFIKKKALQMNSFLTCSTELNKDNSDPFILKASGESTRFEDGSWYWRERYGKDGSSVQTSNPLPFWSDDITRIGFRSDYEGHGDYCIFDGTKVTTFDGLRTNFTPSACPVLVSTPCGRGNPDVFAVAIKTSRSGGLSVQMAGQKAQFIINLSQEGVNVNNEQMGPNEYVKTLYYTVGGVKKEAGHIYRRRGFYKVEIDDTVDVLFKDGKVYIEVADRFRGTMCGLCGNNDDEPSNDMKAPNGCLITDTEQFAKAWTPSTGFECFAEDQTDPQTCLKEEPLPQNYYLQYQLKPFVEPNTCARVVACESTKVPSGTKG